MGGKAPCNLKTLCTCKVSMGVPCPQGLDTIHPSPSDPTQKPGLYIPDIPMAGESVILTCTIRSSCIQTRRKPTMPFNKDGSRSTSISSSMLHSTPRPKDHGTSLQCHLNLAISGKTVSTGWFTSECWWAREDPESERNDKPKRNTRVLVEREGKKSGEQSHLPLASGAESSEVRAEPKSETEEKG